MNSKILQIASRYLSILMLLFAVLALLRGHNFPGGGFIGGLLASLSVIISGIAFSPKYVFKHLKVQPKYYIAIGLSLILLSLSPSLLFNQDLMTGFWLVPQNPAFSLAKVGTPLLFDTGVFFVVIGISTWLFFSLSIHK